MRRKGPSVCVRFVEPKDLSFCVRSDYDHVDEDVLRREIDRKMVILAEVGGKPVGYLRLEYLWLKIPYIGIIRVDRKYRRKGVGAAMIGFLEEHSVRLGHEALYSSSQADEPEPQMWHRKMGFEECGYIAGINNGVGEIFFRKLLKK